MARTRLGERLLERGVITENQLADALRAQQVTGEELGNALMRLGHLGEDQLMRLLCEDADIPFLELDDARPSDDAIRAIPEALARAHGVLPLSQENGRIRVALGNPFDIGAVTALERVSGRPLTVVAAPRNAITALLGSAYGAGDEGGGPAPAGADGGGSAPSGVGVAGVGRAIPAKRAGGQVGSTTRPPPPASPGVSRPGIPASTPARPLPTAASASPVPASMLESSTVPAEATVLAGPAGATGAGTGQGPGPEALVTQAVALGATDIRIEPGPERVVVRYRVDGQLQAGATLSRSAGGELVARLRTLAGIERGLAALPAEGRLRLDGDGRGIEVRVSQVPTLHGPDMVLRVRDRSRAMPELDALGLASADVDRLRGALRQARGLVLVGGLAGAGRTTTMHALLRELDTDRRSVLTLEDPIERELAGVRQTAVDPASGLTFAAGLAALLRHDPDVLMVGDLRDTGTVQLAASAALNGPLVIAGVAADSAAAAVVRVLRMGGESHAVASALRLVVGQRLVRLLCRECRAPAEVAPEVRQRYALGDATLYRARGCGACRQTGYRGRTGVFELLPVEGDVAEALHESTAPSVAALQRLARRPALLHDGLRKVAAGVTSLDEVLNVIGG